MANIKQGMVIFRQWDQGGMEELSVEFSTLEELFHICTSTGDEGDTHRIHHIVIRGYDELDQPRELTLAFRTVTTG